MKCDAKTANKSGPALLLCVSAPNKGAATLRTTKMPDTAVAAVKHSHIQGCHGMRHKIVAGKYGTMLYPYKQIQSTIMRACIPMHCVVSHQRAGTP